MVLHLFSIVREVLENLQSIHLSKGQHPADTIRKKGHRLLPIENLYGMKYDQEAKEGIVRTIFFATGRYFA